MKITAVLTVRNEGAFLLEWLAHHGACGITGFLVFSNDCDDGTDAMLDRLEAMGWLTHVRNPGPHPEGPQWAALKRADRHPMVTGADWLLALDIDEFVNIHVGDRTIHALLAALPGATAVALTWRLFGNDDVVAYEDRPVTQTFIRAAPSVLHWPWRASMFKTLYRNDGSYARLGVHRPRAPMAGRMAAQAWVDGSGAPLPDRYRRELIFTPPGRDCHRLVQLNHYALGAMESYLVKCVRGRAVHDADRLGMDYWVERNFIDVQDRTILALDSRALQAKLRADPVLADLHAAAVAWRKARCAQLLQDEPWRALFGRLLMTPPARVLPRATAERLWNHAGKVSSS